jgi:hypothetical protein
MTLRYKTFLPLLFSLACSSSPPAAVVATSAPSAPPTPRAAPAVPRTFSIQDVALYQAVRVGLVKDGAAIEVAARNAPVIAGRAGLLRVFFKQAFAPGEKPTKVVATLHLQDKAGAEVATKTDTRTLRGSKEPVLESTFNFDLSALELVEGASAFVTFVPDAGNDRRYPEEGALSLGAKRGPKVTLRLVPVDYRADAKTLLPEVGSDTVALYTKLLQNMYPVASVDVAVRAAFEWKTPVQPDGTGWEELLDAIGEERAKDKVESDVFYMGLFRSEASFGQYCKTGCVLGLAPLVPGPAQSGLQFGLSAGFGGERTATTVAHELGHNLGRSHSPCGNPAEPDKTYPYPNAAIGSWGFEASTRTLLEPDSHTDIMGYCPSQWISDFTYGALFNRLSQVNARTRATGSGFSKPSRDRDGDGDSYENASAIEAQPAVRSIRVHGDGTTSWGPMVRAALVRPDLQQGVSGVSPTLEYLSETGVTVAETRVQYIPLDHLPGGYIVGAASEPERFASVRVHGVSAAKGAPLDLRR